VEKAAGRKIVFALLLLAAAVFAVGINWGLPSNAYDSFFFGTASAASGDSTTSYRLSGAGIDHLAGDWEDDPNRAADVAAHPINDRSQPITLIANDRGLTARQIIDRGDQTLARLAADEQSAWAAVAKLSADPNRNSDALESATDHYNQCHLHVAQYVDHYNQSQSGHSESVHRDNVNRARILRRYRLYSDQPDEMITFRALAQIHPGLGQFDPRLYQYGGLWIYPVGGLLRLASFLNLLTLTNDRTHYLDNPADFGRFFIVARAYSMVWGLVAVAAVFALMRRSSGGLVLPTIAGLCFICMPVIIDLAHEAKPHLPGVALLLLALLAASNYVQTGKTKWVFWTAVACGAAAGMVLWAVVGLALIPLTALSGQRRPARLLGVMALMIVIAAAVYFLSNPYVGVHLLHANQRAVLKSNLSNTRAMYHADAASGEVNAFRLILAGTSLPLALAGVCGLVILILVRRSTVAAGQARHVGWLIAALALLMWLQFAAFAAAKPGEYGRFAAFIDVALMLAAVAAVGRLIAGATPRAMAGAILVAATVTYSFAYERGFCADAQRQNSRSQAAADLAQISQRFGPQAHPTLWVLSEPAPYCLPPVDLFRWKIVLLPPGSGAPAGADGVLVKPDDTIQILDPAATPISWADKRFDIIPGK